MELSGLLPLCLGLLFSGVALFRPAVVLTKLKPPYVALPRPAVALTGLPGLSGALLNRI